MTDVLTAAATRLANVLAEENTALAVFDLRRATTLLADKEAATRALLAAQQSAPGSLGRPTAIRLADLLKENRRLLERAMTVQGQVIGILAGALRKAAGPGRYAASGTPAHARQPIAFALSARV